MNEIMRHVVKEALGNLNGQRLRTGLSLLGILVGVASVVALLSGGSMAIEKATRQFKLLGTDIFTVTFYSQSMQGSQTNVKSITLEDIAKLQEKVTGIKEIAPYAYSFSPLNYQGHQVNSTTVSSTALLKSFLNIEMESGHFLLPLYLQKSPFVVMVGNDIYHQLKKQYPGDPLGRQIQIKNVSFTIVGVLSPWKGNNFFPVNLNEAVIMPITTAKRLDQDKSLHDLIVRVDTQRSINEYESKIKSFFSQSDYQQQVYLRSPQKMIEQMEAQQQTFDRLLAYIGGVSLLVGGIGIMNMMLVSVNERKREIGIRKAVGALKRDIQLLFLIEAIILCCFGGALGVIVGILVSAVIAYMAEWQFALYCKPIFIGFSIAMLTGFFFGWYPAKRAAALEPMAVLRM